MEQMVAPNDMLILKCSDNKGVVGSLTLLRACSEHFSNALVADKDIDASAAIAISERSAIMKLVLKVLHEIAF